MRRMTAKNGLLHVCAVSWLLLLGVKLEMRQHFRSVAAYALCMATAPSGAIIWNGLPKRKNKMLNSKILAASVIQ